MVFGEQGLFLSSIKFYLSSAAGSAGGSELADGAGSSSRSINTPRAAGTAVPPLGTAQRPSQPQPAVRMLLSTSRASFLPLSMQGHGSACVWDRRKEPGCSEGLGSWGRSGEVWEGLGRFGRSGFLGKVWGRFGGGLGKVWGRFGKGLGKV